MTPDEEAYRATLRPSRIRDVQAGALAWTRVDVIDIETGHGLAARRVLEALGVQVNVMRIGQARQLVAALSGGVTAPFVLVGMPR